MSFSPEEVKGLGSYREKSCVGFLRTVHPFLIFGRKCLEDLTPSDVKALDHGGNSRSEHLWLIYGEL